MEMLCLHLSGQQSLAEVNAALYKATTLSLCRQAESMINFEVCALIQHRKVSLQWHSVSTNGQTKWSGEGH